MFFFPHSLEDQLLPFQIAVSLSGFLEFIEQQLILLDQLASLVFNIRQNLSISTIFFLALTLQCFELVQSFGEALTQNTFFLVVIL